MSAPSTSSEGPIAPSGKRPPIHRRLYNWVLAWANSPYAGWALFLISFAESSVFPIPPDVLLIALVLGDPKKAFKFAGICTLGSTLGGVFGYLIGWGFWESTKELFFRIPGLTEAAFDAQARRYDEWGLAIVFIAAFTPIPYKLITISAGVFQISFLPFVAASIIGRGARFFLVAGLLYKFGERIRPIIDKHFEKLALLFGLLLVGGFVLLKFLQ